MAESTAPPPGFYSDETGRRRWWDGTTWTEHFADPAGVARGGQVTAEERRRILDRAVARYAEHGYRVESDSGTQVVVAKRQRVNVLPQLLLVLITGGLWLVVLGIRLLDWPRDRAILSVDAAGQLQGEFFS